MLRYQDTAVHYRRIGEERWSLDDSASRYDIEYTAEEYTTFLRRCAGPVQGGSGLG